MDKKYCSWCGNIMEKDKGRPNGSLYKGVSNFDLDDVEHWFHFKCFEEFKKWYNEPLKVVEEG